MSCNEAATMENNCGFMKCEKLDKAATWVGSNVAAAFFASLERCACINISTSDADEDDDEAKDRPLMLTKYPSFGIDDVTSNPTMISDNKLSTPTPV